MNESTEEMKDMHVRDGEQNMKGAIFVVLRVCHVACWGRRASELVSGKRLSRVDDDSTTTANL